MVMELHGIQKRARECFTLQLQWGHYSCFLNTRLRLPEPSPAIQGNGVGAPATAFSKCHPRISSWSCVMIWRSARTLHSCEKFKQSVVKRRIPSSEPTTATNLSWSFKPRASMTLSQEQQQMSES